MLQGENFALTELPYSVTNRTKNRNEKDISEKRKKFQRTSNLVKFRDNVTFLPALLLCLFMTARGLFPLARASVNCSENQLPNLMLLLQPDQVQPFCVTPLKERSQSQLSVFPALQEAVTA